MKLSILLQIATMTAFLSGAYSLDGVHQARRLRNKKCKAFESFVYEGVLPAILSGTELMVSVLSEGPSIFTFAWVRDFDESVGINDKLVESLLFLFKDCKQTEAIGEIMTGGLGTLVALGGQVAGKLDGPLSNDFSREERQALTQVIKDRIDLRCGYSAILEECFEGEYPAELDECLDDFDETTKDFIVTRARGGPVNVDLPKCK